MNCPKNWKLPKSASNLFFDLFPHWLYHIEQNILTVAGKESQLVAILHQHGGVPCNLRILFN